MADNATSADVAEKIGPGLLRSAIAARQSRNGHEQTIDLTRPLGGDCELSILTASDDDSRSLEVLRHSTAHVMAEAICSLFPQTQLVYGPPLEDGFYYDIDLDRSLTPVDFQSIEARMSQIIKEDRPFTRYEFPRTDVLAKLNEEGNRYKIDNAERADGDTLSFYVTGEERGKDFEDLCRGPHIPSTRRIKAFKLRQVSRSHYRGDVNDQPLQRVYGTAFFKKASLEAYEKQQEEAKRRDHRVLGRELDLFAITDRVGTGLILWLPKGMRVRTQLQEFLTSEMIKLGYEFIATPHIGQLGLYRTSGHYPYYEDSQYPAMFETGRGKALQSVLQFAQRVSSQPAETCGEKLQVIRSLLDSISRAWGPIRGLDTEAPVCEVIESLRGALAEEPGYLLKPMNCPHHIQVYASRPRSYKDLPVRYAEYGTVYRYEQSGEVGGLTRARGFTQDDAHLFCTPEQLQDEVVATVKLTRHVLETLGLTDYRVRVGLRDSDSDKYVGSLENWEKAEAAIIAAAQASGVPFTRETGEAAFYGPKIDFIVKDCIGRSWQLGTVQVDYNLPERFELSYIGADNRPHVPVMVHRAPFGSMERFIGILIEHFEGAFPLWLSPTQVGVVTVSEKSDDYARRLFDKLKEAGLRVELDVSSEKLGPKKHRFRKAKVNYILVVGEQEVAGGTVNVNDRAGNNLGSFDLESFTAACIEEIETKGRRCVAPSSN